MTRDTKRFAVGDPVVVTSVNRGRGYEGAVAKVGRKLVTIVDRRGVEEIFRIDTGSKNDAYQHECVWTADEFADREARHGARERITNHGVRFDFGAERRLATDQLRSLADLLDEFRASRTEES